MTLEKRIEQEGDDRVRATIDVRMQHAQRRKVTLERMLDDIAGRLAEINLEIDGYRDDLRQLEE